MAPFDREGALKRAEKALRLGKVDAAIDEYQALVLAQPRDWNSANALGDLFVRAGQLDKGVEQYTRIADHLDVADRTILRWRSQAGVRAGHRRPSTGTGSGAQRVDGEGDWDAVEARSITTRTQDHHRVTPPPSSGRGGSTRAAR